MDTAINVRVSPSEKRAVKEAARKRGLSVSDFVRTVANEAAMRLTTC
ncbi:plasmid mobilization protein [Mesorhizobium mediterraneum]